MSDKMAKRIEQLQLAKFNADVAKIPKEELDKEYERLTGMDCDEAAVVQSDKDFRTTILQAIENLKQKRKKADKEMLVAYA